LERENDINLLVLNSIKGWMTEENMIEWFKEVLLPYVKENHCLLLFDSYEAHISDKVKNFLQGFSKVHVGIIVGGTTDEIQPLDNGTNKVFKDFCRKKSIEYSNAMLRSAMETKAFAELKNNIPNEIMLSKLNI